MTDAMTWPDKPPELKRTVAVEVVDVRGETARWQVEEPSDALAIVALRNMLDHARRRNEP